MNEVFNFFLEIWQLLGEMSLYLLFGFLMAGILHILIPQKLIEKNLSGRGISKSIKSALFGVPMPLCSCGVIPVTASLRRHGAGRGSVISFLVSTPQTGVDSIMITYGMLGGIFTLFRVITSFLSGIICGTFTEIFVNENNEDDSIKVNTSNEESNYGNKFNEIINYGLVRLPQDIGKPLVIGIIIAAFLGVLIPESFFSYYLGSDLLTMLIMLLVGLPLYVCSTASVPVAAAFIKMGISPGAVLVFLITGPATNAATVTTIGKILGKKTVFVYLITIAICAVVGGFILNSLGLNYEIIESISKGNILPGWLRHVAAVALLGVLLNAFIKSSIEKNKDERMEEMNDINSEFTENLKLDISGMSCSHCAANIKKSLLELKGIENAEVNFQKKEALISGNSINKDEVINTIKSLGYDAEFKE